MAEIQDKEIEGILSAHRELLTRLLSARFEEDAGFQSRLEQEAEVHDGEEDPGAIPTSDFAVQEARAREIRAILAIASSKAAAGKRSSRSKGADS